MNPTERLLSYLNKYGVGIFKPVNDILKEDFPVNENDEYGEFSKITKQVTSLLSLLQADGLVKYRIDGFFGSAFGQQNHGYSHGSIYAAITQKGSDSLKKTVTNVQNIGTNYGMALQDSEASFRDFHPTINPPTQPTIAAAKDGIMISIGKFIIKHIVIVVLAGLILAYLVYKLGWN